MKTLIILNPKSRAGDSGNIESILKKKFPGSDTRLVKTAYPGQATEIARRAVGEHVDTIIVVGGDGTIHEVLNGILGSSVAMGIIPAGTANDLASYYRLPAEVEKASNIILRRRIHPADVIQVNHQYYITAGGMGLPSDVASIANSIKSRGTAGRLLGRFLSSKIYIIAALWAILAKPLRRNYVTIRSEPLAFASDILSLTINNQPFLGKSFLISPGAANDDGKLDVCLIKNPKRRFAVIPILIKVLSGKHVHLPCVTAWRTESLVVEAENPLPFLEDGELVQKSKQFRIKIFPRALNLIVPESSA